MDPFLLPPLRDNLENMELTVPEEIFRGASERLQEQLPRFARRALYFRATVRRALNVELGEAQRRIHNALQRAGEEYNVLHYGENWRTLVEEPRELGGREIVNYILCGSFFPIL